MSKTEESWNSVDNEPEGPNRIIWVFNPKATFDTSKQKLMFYRKEEGFPPGVTHWKEKQKPPKEYQS